MIQIQTPFGGGKTHSLIKLYHLFTAGQRLADQEFVSQTLKAAAVGEVPPVRVATFVGTAASPLKDKAPRGRPAEQLGRYELLCEHDQGRQAQGKDLLHELLRDQPTLVLMDEIAQYVVKATLPTGRIERSRGTSRSLPAASTGAMARVLHFRGQGSKLRTQATASPLALAWVAARW